MGNVIHYRQQNKKIVELPFNSTNKYQVSIHEIQDGNNDSATTQQGYLLVMKGAPERILQRCSTMLLNEKEVEMTPALRQDFEKAYLDLGGMGERVLGFCDFRLDEQKFPKGFPFDAEELNFPVENLRFVGLISVSFYLLFNNIL